MIGRRVLCLLFACAAANAGAQSFITMGRLFTTPSERAQLDQARGSGAAIAPGGAGGPGAAGGGGPAGGLGGAAGGAAGGAGGGAGGQGASGASAPMAGDGDAGAAPAPPEPVRLTGMIRRSDGHTTVFVNNEEQPARPAGQGKSARVQVNGRTVVLKPGQSYDPATGEIRETGR